MSGGVFAVARNIFEHDFFDKEPFTEREAWIWLIREAAWKERKVKVANARRTLARGQCALSVRFAAERWQWSKSRVARFLERLKSEAMIGTDVDHTITVVTICNYDEYQRVSLPTGTASGTDTGTEAGQKRDKQEDSKHIQDREEVSLTGPSALPAKSIEAEVFSLGKAVLGKSAGGVVVNLRKACEYDDAYALELLRKASEKHDPMSWIQAALRATKDRPYRNVDGMKVSEQTIESREDREWRKREADIYRFVQ